MSRAALDGFELSSPASSSSCSLLLQLGRRDARTHYNRFNISRFGFGVKYSGFLHLDQSSSFPSPATRTFQESRKPQQ